MAINLQKGQKIDLIKKTASGSVSKLQKFCIGVNWGVIDRSYSIQETKGGFLGFGGKSEYVTKHFKEAVDLDASCVLFNANKELVDVVSFKQLTSKDGAIIHSGDDREGDVDGDDGLDNEIISVDLTKINSSVDKIVFFLNSYKKQDFATVPFASIRLYEGTPEVVSNVFATYDVSADPTFKGFVSMIMGTLYKTNGEWKFDAIGEPTPALDLQETIKTIMLKHI
ncbi:tellurium resistance TerZ family protein [Cellulophaga sp. E16_2]|uniref:Stress protein n=1 Tax=Cellulophaga algicola (strain DSM 14237 / IC166 / ACAM 630) TaxID=688270 RepID=E6X8V3_CELAD|nr:MULTISPECIES: TerD family protein [Cellulophaga]ADV48698.1 stress protein [Cellulophaga algicola DSM 14237]MBO0591152.1 tellurium resistance TerZ family protein [Cellulophaga sp. E16_2]